MRCLVLGATGLIGSHVMAACEERGYACLGTWYRWPNSEYAPLDLRDGEAVDDLIDDYEPDVTFLAAGIAAAGYGEQHPGECRAVTVDGTAHVAAAVARHGGSLVMFSSDAVFGECRTARREEDAVSPQGVWAAAKVEAERVVREALPERHLILRTGWVYGADDRNRGAAGWVLRGLANNEPMKAANDRHGQPTYVGDLANVALELTRLGETGTVHAVGPDRHTEFTFARLVAHIFGADADLVESATAAELDDDARPAKVWLDRFKLRSLLGARAVRGPGEGLRAVRDEVVKVPAAYVRAA